MECVVRDRWVCVCSSAVLGGQKEWVRGREGGIREAGEEEVRSCEDASLSISLYPSLLYSSFSKLAPEHHLESKARKSALH